MSKVEILRTRDPFEAERMKHEARERCLVKEIIRLKLKCGEEITEAELIGNEWGGAPTAFYIGTDEERIRKFEEAHRAADLHK